jgi:hypothetical protein
MITRQLNRKLIFDTIYNFARHIRAAERSIVITFGQNRSLAFDSSKYYQEGESSEDECLLAQKPEFFSRPSEIPNLAL